MRSRPIYLIIVQSISRVDFRNFLVKTLVRPAQFGGHETARRARRVMSRVAARAGLGSPEKGVGQSDGHLISHGVTNLAKRHSAVGSERSAVVRRCSEPVRELVIGAAV